MTCDDDESDDEIIRMMAAWICPDMDKAVAVLEDIGELDIDPDAEAVGICRRYRARQQIALRVFRGRDPDSIPREERIRLLDEAGAFDHGEDARLAALVLATRRLRQRRN
jgi:hypothetical protein